jgi:hypothetical protein
MVYAAWLQDGIRFKEIKIKIRIKIKMGLRRWLVRCTHSRVVDRDFGILV